MMRWQKRGKIHKTSKMTCEKYDMCISFDIGRAIWSPNDRQFPPLNGESQIYKYDTVEILARKHA